jgi:hypothetical protein
MSMTKSGTDLFDISKGRRRVELLLSQKGLEVTSGKIFEDEIMKYRTLKVPGRSMAEPADNIRMTNPVEGHRFVLKVFDQRAFQISVKIILEKYV